MFDNERYDSESQCPNCGSFEIDFGYIYMEDGYTLQTNECCECKISFQEMCELVYYSTEWNSKLEVLKGKSSNARW